MSRHPGPQAKADRAVAEGDKRHWSGRRDAATDETSRATFQRGVDRAQAKIDRADAMIDRESGR